MNARTLSIVAAIFLAAILSYLAGMWTTYRNWAPWQVATEVQEAVRSWRATGRLLPALAYSRRAPNVPDERHTVAEPAAVSPGLWAISRFDAETGRFVLDLLDQAGTVVQSRPLDYSRVSPGGNPAEFPHRFAMLPDGSVLVLWDDAKGLARLDACGDPVWSRTDLVYHHSITPGVNGFWAWEAGDINEGEDQRMVRFDPDTGEILERISLIDDVIGLSAANSLALTMPEGYKFRRDLGPGERPDLFHPNDVEELMPAMAAAFPQFEAGDLLVSLRNLDMVAVIGRRSHAVKWAAYGPWVQQHDADFQADGTISVFSNNIDRFRSTLLSVRPGGEPARDLFEGRDLRFDSFIMGAHQRLANGNWLIVSTMQGRVIEATPDGRIVREYSNIVDDNHNAIVIYSEQLPDGFLTASPVCGG